ncbi:unnamed protein product [Prorocentrum cordatum]|uniref:Uncharacterized protein n=1 Tax=Prorocentrum cordatum TaxID=2364126 RepID=A0ABN9PBP8_9DINO|nr:unnamed protein product [Polarella glacialis]
MISNIGEGQKRGPHFKILMEFWEKQMSMEKGGSTAAEHVKVMNVKRAKKIEGKPEVVKVQLMVELSGGADVLNLREAPGGGRWQAMMGGAPRGPQERKVQTFCDRRKKRP